MFLKRVSHNPFAKNGSNNNYLNKVASEGRGGDTILGHLTPGDIVVPAEKVTPTVHKLLQKILGRQLSRYTVGSPKNSINTKTGLREFDDGGGDGGDGGDSGGDSSDSGSDSGGDDGGSDSADAASDSSSTDASGGFGADSGFGGLDNDADTSVSNTADPNSTSSDTSQQVGVFGADFGQVTTAIAGTPVDQQSISDLNTAQVNDYGPVGDMIANQIDKFTNNPIASVINLGVGFLGGPIAGAVNTASGKLGGPTVGSMVTGLAQDITGYDPEDQTGAFTSGPNSAEALGGNVSAGGGQQDNGNGAGTGGGGNNGIFFTGPNPTDASSTTAPQANLVPVDGNPFQDGPNLILGSQPPPDTQNLWLTGS